jgi:hypothetical protein
MAEDANERKRLKAESAAKKAEAKALRPWFKKKRVIIPSAFLILAVFASISGGGSSSHSASKVTPIASQS